MRRNAFKALDHIEALNRIKQEMLENNLSASEKDFRDAFKRIGIPSNILFWIEFKSSGQIEYIDGEYVWKNTNPIHYQVLQKIYDSYNAKTKKYYLNRITKVKSSDYEVLKAVELLKSKGYIILIPCNDVYKKL